MTCFAKTAKSSTEDFSIYLAQNDIVIDELSYNEMIENQKDNSGSWLPPYKKRRKTWGADFSIKYSYWFKPINYQSFFYNERDSINDFDTLYGSTNLGYISLLGALRYNSPLGGLSLGVGVGYYYNEGSDNLELSIIPVVAELALTLDAFLKEPYVAPYGAIGMAYMYMREKQEVTNNPTNPLPPDPTNPLPPNPTATVSNSESRGQFALYYDVGLLLQLDWLERRADLAMYSNSGIENAYIKVGMISVFNNLNALNPSDSTQDDGTVITNRDLKSNLAFHLGFQIEF